MDNTHQFIEEMAITLETRGFPRMAGRVLAWLMVCKPEHQSMPDLVEALDASKSSISTATRMLIQFDLIKRVSIRGERKDYYVIRESLWNNPMREAQEKVKSFRMIAEQGLQLLKNEPNVRTETLKEMKEVYDFWEKQFPLLQEKWDSLKNKP